MSSIALLLLDFSNLFYRGLYVHTDLSWKGTPTGGLYGFITQFASYVNEFCPVKVIACDDTRPYARSVAFPKYKSKRKQPDEDAAKVISMNRKWCHEFLHLIGEPMLFIQGWEADDLVAHVAYRYQYDYDQIIVVSNDNDLYQLLDQSNLSLYLGTAANRRYVELSDYLSMYPSLTCASDWRKVIALTGGHNDIPGVSGIGEKRAVKLLEKGNEEKLTNTIKKHEDFEMSVELATLPYGKLDLTKFAVPDSTQVDHNRLTDFFRRFGIRKSGAIDRAIDWVDLTK